MGQGSVVRQTMPSYTYQFLCHHGGFLQMQLLFFFFFFFFFFVCKGLSLFVCLFESVKEIAMVVMIAHVGIKWSKFQFTQARFNST